MIREARVPQAGGGNKLQVPDSCFFVCLFVSLLYTGLKEAPLILCCHENSWVHLKLFLKP